MNYREVELLAPESIATDGTRTLDLGLNQPVSRLDIIWKKTNTNRTPIGHPHLIVDQIDVVDGSDVLFSLDGAMAQAAAFFTQDRQPGSMINYELGQWSMQIASIYFGRYLWDELYALDPKKHNNIQIKVKHTLASGGSTGTVADLSIYAHVFDEKVITPKGFIQTREIYSSLLVASTWYYVNLPMDYPIRGIMFGMPQSTEGPDYDIAQFKVSENGGKNILAQSTMERYLLVQSGNLEPWVEKVLAKTAAAATDLSIYVSPHWERTGVFNNEGAGVGVGRATSAGSLMKVQTAGAAYVVEGVVEGFAPFGQVWVPFTEQDSEAAWEVQSKGQARLDFQAVAAPDTTHQEKVAVVQQRLY